MHLKLVMLGNLLSERITQTEGQRHFYSIIGRKYIPVTVMPDPDLGIHIPFLSEEGTHSQQVLESKMAARIISVNDLF